MRSDRVGLEKEVRHLNKNTRNPDRECNSLTRVSSSSVAVYSVKYEKTKKISEHSSIHSSGGKIMAGLTHDCKQNQKTYAEVRRAVSV